MTKAKRPSRSASRRPRPLAHAASRADRPRITTVIFDLDDTLYDCLAQRVHAAHSRAAEALAAAGVPASAEDILTIRMQAFMEDPQLTRIDPRVLDHFGVPVAEREKLVRIARHAFFTLPVEKLALFPGTLPVLRGLKKRGVRIFLVSFGDPGIQHDKVIALGLDREPSIERVFYADTAHLVTKEAIFRTILRQVEREPRRVLVVGDRPSSEIRAGKLLGMHTARVRGGEFSSLKPQGPEEQADFEISQIDAVLNLPFEFGSNS